jgi:uncharacterized protein (TIGR02466 family)
MSKINLEFLFPTALYSIQLEKIEEIHKNLINYIYSLKEKEEKKLENKKYKASTQGGWHSSFLDTDVPQVKALCQKLFPVLNSIVGGLGWNDEDFELRCSAMWSIINPKYAYNTSHTHKESLLSVSYYLKVPKGGNSGNFKIKDPRHYNTFFPAAKLKKDITPQIHPMAIGAHGGQGNSIEIEPKEGLMLVFPSWLEHKVTQNLSEEKDPDRIVISFNILQIKKLT